MKKPFESQNEFEALGPHPHQPIVILNPPLKEFAPICSAPVKQCRTCIQVNYQLMLKLGKPVYQDSSGNLLGQHYVPPESIISIIRMPDGKLLHHQRQLFGNRIAQRKFSSVFTLKTEDFQQQITCGILASVSGGRTDLTASR